MFNEYFNILRSRSLILIVLQCFVVDGVNVFSLIVSTEFPTFNGCFINLAKILNNVP